MTHSLSKIEDRFRATLLGGAIGDALGNPVEGYNSEQIQRKYGRVIDYCENWDPPGTCTDDTELTLLIGESLIEVGCYSSEDIGRRMIPWIKKSTSWGMACQAACMNLIEGKSSSESGIFSAGNGAAMRIAPIALLYSHPEDTELQRCIVEKSTRITHTDPRAFAGALAMTSAYIQLLNIDGDIIPEYFLKTVQKRVRGISDEFSSALIRVAEVLESPIDVASRYIGTGGFVVQSVPFSLFCFLKYPKDFSRAVLSAVNAGGDADSTA